MGPVRDAGGSQPGPLSNALELLGWTPPVLLSCVAMMNLCPLRSKAWREVGFVLGLWDISTPSLALDTLPFYLVVAGWNFP